MTATDRLEDYAVDKGVPQGQDGCLDQAQVEWLRFMPDGWDGTPPYESQQPPYNKLVELLRRKWDIECSWDGLRKFWYVGLTEDGVRKRDWDAELRREECENTWPAERTRLLRFRCSECHETSPEVHPQYCPACGRKVFYGRKVAW